MTTNVYFISGHLDFSKDEFETHYVPKINEALASGANFVIGDARGVDTMAQEYLADKTTPGQVTIYHIYSSPRNCVSANYLKVGHYTNYTERDAAMTLASTHDIAYVRSVEEQKKLFGPKYRHRISGTEKNLIRRAKQKI